MIVCGMCGWCPLEDRAHPCAEYAEEQGIREKFKEITQCLRL